MKLKALDYKRNQICDVLSLELSNLNGRDEGRCELSNGYVTFWKNHLKNECKLLRVSDKVDSWG